MFSGNRAFGPEPESLVLSDPRLVNTLPARRLLERLPQSPSADTTSQAPPGPPPPTPTQGRGVVSWDAQACLEVAANFLQCYIRLPGCKISIFQQKNP